MAGTERGVKEPSPTFSTCFGAPFMPRRPTEYARLLRNRVAQAGSRVWLVNTGWTGGAYGVGQRMPIAETRRMVGAILAGELDDAPTRRDPWFGLEVPLNVSGVRPLVLDARGSWQSPASYDQAASALARRFVENFTRYASDVSAEVLAAAPEPR